MIPAKELREVLVPKAFYAILEAQGRPPTVDLVTAWLVENGHIDGDGKPSRNVIAEANRACFADLSRRLKQPMLEGLPEEAVRLVFALRNELYKEATETFDGERTELRAAAQAEVARAQAAVDAAQVARDETRQLLDKALRDLDEAASAIAQRDKDVEAAEAAKAELRRRLERAETDLEMTRRSVQALEAAAHARERAHGEALAKAAHELTEEHKRGLLAVERERAETKVVQKHAAELLARLDKLHEAERERVRQMAVLETQLVAERLAVRQAREAFSKLDTQLQGTQETLRRVTEEHAGLAAQLEAQQVAHEAATAPLRERLAGFGTLSPHTLEDLLLRAFLEGGAHRGKGEAASHARTAARALLQPFDVAVRPAAAGLADTAHPDAGANAGTAGPSGTPPAAA
ncbi:DNA-binding protein [Cupriavidus pampae]|uniref:KfrA N-terminal DNA-binding domain-containing protein n=1 Tax=Cupriavidus pampae TaxID=659251 RepID=A0ABN7ZKF1_9BURK|nr:DNA-binding protein [Cupriavidus pampae]CAG9184482.1 hypothetical protein LMG32289_05634 [Cupriavidus pampae]